MATKKIKLFFILIILFSFKFINAQSGAVESDLQKPNIIYPTPEAFKFTQYGEIPVNESTGNATTNIPFFTFKGGKIEVPISVSHNGGGVKVDEVNSITGVSWQLNAYGLITRIVNDLVDENYIDSRILHSSEELLGYIPNQSSELANIVKSTGIDTEADIFNFNFGEYSGSFFFDENMKPRLVKYDKELKIEISSSNPIVNGITIFNKRTIIITTPDGTKYSFGGLNASEITRNYIPQGGSTPYAQTGFYLFKIENITGDIIMFNYSNSVSGFEDIGRSQIFKKDSHKDPNANCAPNLANTLMQEHSNRLETIGKLRLNSITTNRDASSVIFYYNPVGTPLFRYYLNEIKYVNNSNILYKKIKFNYLLPQGNYEKRFFINSIDFYGKNNDLKDFSYSFEYNNPEALPDRFSYSQDYGGYFNGINNSSLVPKTSDPFFSDSNQALLGDRSVSEIKSLYGTLKKIIYPTKGYSEFEYELPYKGEEPIYQPYFFTANYQNPNYNVTSICATTSNGYNVYTSTYYPYTDSTLNLSIPTQLNFSLNGIASGMFTHPIYINLIAINTVTHQETLYTFLPQTSSINQNYTINNQNYFQLGAGEYYFKLQIKIHYTDCKTCSGFGSNTNSIYCTATLSFPEGTISTYNSGPRIKRIKSSPDDSNEQITRYYYNLAAQKNRLFDSRIAIRTPHYISESITNGTCNAFNGVDNYCYPYTIFSRIINSSPQNNIYISDFNNSMYEHVTVSYGGDNFEKGGKQSTYFLQSDLPISNINSFFDDSETCNKVSNNSLKNGTLLKEIIFKDNPTFNHLTKEFTSGKLKETEYEYISLSSKNYELTNFYVSKVFSPLMCIVNSQNMNLYVSNYYFGHYNLFSWWYTLGSVNQKEYFANNIIENTTFYTYESELAGLPSTITKTNSKGETIVTNSFYPKDLPSKPNAQNLINNHILTPLVTQTFNGVDKLSEQETQYRISSTEVPGQNFLLPELVKFGKGNNNLEKKITFNSYDIKGNITQYTQENGVPVSILWGYNKTQPVAKLENIAYNSIPAALTTAIQTVTDSATSTEAEVIAALNVLRSSTDANMVKAMITTYTYIPLVGVSTITDPKGDTQTFTYDSFGRLQNVKDRNGNILSENEYHYRP